MSTLVKNINIF